MKRIMTVLFAVCLLLSVAACGNDAPAVDTNASYIITVVEANGDPVVGYMVSICENTDNGMCFMPVKTDENGVATFSKDAVPVQENLKVRVMSPSGVELPLGENGELEYVLIPEGVTTLTVTVATMPE